jgi:F-type H+-transporting ATPase subunit b
MLTPDGSLLVTLVLFLLLVPILNRILFQPITHILNERDRLTTGSSTDARAILNTIDRKLADYEEGIRGARSEGYRLIESRRALAAAERQDKIGAARAAAEAEIGAARAEIAADAAAARTRLESDAREIADRISSTLLGRAVGGTR